MPLPRNRAPDDPLSPAQLRGGDESTLVRKAQRELQVLGTPRALSCAATLPEAPGAIQTPSQHWLRVIDTPGRSLQPESSLSKKPNKTGHLSDSCSEPNIVSVIPGKGKAVRGTEVHYPWKRNSAGLCGGDFWMENETSKQK